MNNINAILFDLDGTITDSGEGIMNSFAYTLGKMGQDVPSRDVLRRYIGPPLRVSFAQMFGEDKVDEALATYIHRMRDQKAALLENFVYDGILDVLVKLKKTGRSLYICSSKAEPLSQEVLNHFNILDYFSSIYGSQLDGSGANKSDIIGRALNENKLDPQNTLMIGDRHHDIDGAKAHGVSSIGVAWGYGSEKELREAGADHYVETPKDLLNLVLSN